MQKLLIKLSDERDDRPELLREEDVLKNFGKYPGARLHRSTKIVLRHEYFFGIFDNSRINFVNHL